MYYILKNTQIRQVCIKTILTFDSEECERILEIRIKDNTKTVRKKLLFEVYLKIRCVYEKIKVMYDLCIYLVAKLIFND